MTRIDVPTLQCDRCGSTTQDTNEMGKYRNLRSQYDGYAGSKENWDLCSTCWTSFQLFIKRLLQYK